jgi:hypothetical protein
LGRAARRSAANVRRWAQKLNMSKKLCRIEANEKTARLPKGALLGNRTHCPYGHPFSGIY